MIKLSKTTAFVILFIVATLCGISLSYIDWDIVFGANQSANVIFSEISETLVFFLSSLVFMIIYVNALKKEREAKQ